MKTDDANEIEFVNNPKPFHILKIAHRKGCLDKNAYKICVQLKRFSLGLDKVRFNLFDDLVLLTVRDPQIAEETLQWLENDGWLKIQNKKISIWF